MTSRLRVPPFGGTARDTAFLLEQLLRGKINSTGTLTLTSSSTLTVIYNPLVSGASFITLAPLTAEAADEPWFIAAQSAGSNFTVSHSVGASATDRIFAYAILG